MIETLTATHFHPYLQQTFMVLLPDQELPLVLNEIVLYGTRPAQTITAHGRELTLRPDPYGLIFRGPLQPALPQQMYLLAHPDWEEPQTVFLVPVGIDAAGRYYELGFN